jgi:hypothetical protein
LKFTGSLAFSEVRFDIQNATSDELNDFLKGYKYQDLPISGANAIRGMRSERSPGKEMCMKGDIHTHTNTHKHTQTHVLPCVPVYP